MIAVRLSFRIHGFDIACGAGQSRARQVELIQRADLVIAGARQIVLRGDHFDVGGDARLKPALRLGDFFLGQFVAQIRDVHRIPRGSELIESGFHLGRRFALPVAGGFPRHAVLPAWRALLRRGFARP